MTFNSSGVTVGSVVVRSARYWMYREFAVIAPGAGTGTNADHEIGSSGVAAAPVRTLRATLVPGGVTAFQVTLCQSTSVVASNTRDRNDPLAAYGVIRIQSMRTLPALTL